jgi:KipI family sensor histidine kinase inhibitor
MRVLPYGAAALLVEPDDPATVLALAAALLATAGVLEVVPAARTVLVRGEPGMLADLERRLPGIGDTLRPEEAPAGENVVLGVHYDGADLAPTAAELGISPDELIRRHAAGRYVVAFCGFAPGFAYLTSRTWHEEVPRRASPRKSVPTGSVGLAGGFSGVYPRESPGGWQLLGRTDQVMFDPARDPAALLRPGTRVRFVDEASR